MSEPIIRLIDVGVMDHGRAPDGLKRIVRVQKVIQDGEWVGILEHMECGHTHGSPRQKADQFQHCMTCSDQNQQPHPGK